MQVIVVDVEDRDASVWQNLSAYDGGVSGWRLLWDRWCPIPSLRCACACSAHPPMSWGCESVLLMQPAVRLLARVVTWTHPCWAVVPCSVPNLWWTASCLKTLNGVLWD